jgi:hypothetical protein
MDKREKNARALDPNRFKSEAKSLSQMPGGPHNTNPVNFNMAAAEMGQVVGGQSIYDDFSQKGAYEQTGTTSLDPTKYEPSQMSNKPKGVGKNAGNYGLQDQPSSSLQEPMEGMRQAQEATNKGLVAHPFLGMTGTPTPLAGNFTNQFESQSMNTLGLQGMQSTEGVSPPGTTMIKNGKQKGKK